MTNHGSTTSLDNLTRLKRWCLKNDENAMTTKMALRSDTDDREWERQLDLGMRGGGRRRDKALLLYIELYKNKKCYEMALWGSSGGDIGTIRRRIKTSTTQNTFWKFFFFFKNKLWDFDFLNSAFWQANVQKLIP